MKQYMLLIVIDSDSISLKLFISTTKTTAFMKMEFREPGIMLLAAVTVSLYLHCISIVY